MSSYFHADFYKVQQIPTNINPSFASKAANERTAFKSNHYFIRADLIEAVTSFLCTDDFDHAVNVFNEDESYYLGTSGFVKVSEIPLSGFE